MVSVLRPSDPCSSRLRFVRSTQLFGRLAYLFRALRCLLRRQLHVELLDGISVCLSMVRRDFDTASSVMFLLRLGELLEEWT